MDPFAGKRPEIKAPKVATSNLKDAFKEIYAEHDKALQARQEQIQKEVQMELERLETQKDLEESLVKWRKEKINQQVGDLKETLQKQLSFHDQVLKIRQAQIQQEVDSELNAMDQIKQAKEKMLDDLKTAINGWASHFSKTLNDMVWGAKVSFKEILKSFAKMSFNSS